MSYPTDAQARSLPRALALLRKASASDGLSPQRAREQVHALALALATEVGRTAELEEQLAEARAAASRTD